MAYARCSENSDVYVYASIYGGYQIHFGRNSEIREKLQANNLPDSTLLETLEELKAFLLKAKEAGLLIPDHAFERIDRELKGNERRLT